jgi:hypothetical protein
MRLTFEDLDIEFFCHGSGVSIHRDIETQHNSVLWGLFQHSGTLHDILPVDWTDVDGTDWDLA